MLYTQERNIRKRYQIRMCYFAKIVSLKKAITAKGVCCLLTGCNHLVYIRSYATFTISSMFIVHKDK